MRIHECRPFTSAVFGVLQAAFPFHHRPARKVVLRQLREDAREINLPVAKAAEPAKTAAPAKAMEPAKTATPAAPAALPHARTMSPAGSMWSMAATLFPACQNCDASTRAPRFRAVPSAAPKRSAISGVRSTLTSPTTPSWAKTRVVPLNESRAFLNAIGIDGELIHTPGHSDDSVSLLLDEGMAVQIVLQPKCFAFLSCPSAYAFLRFISVNMAAGEDSRDNS